MSAHWQRSSGGGKGLLRKGAPLFAGSTFFEGVLGLVSLAFGFLCQIFAGENEAKAWCFRFGTTLAELVALSTANHCDLTDWRRLRGGRILLPCPIGLARK